jgi:hypothetical protein
VAVSTVSWKRISVIAREAQPVVEVAGVEVAAEGERRARGVDPAGVDDGGLAAGD